MAVKAFDEIYESVLAENAGRTEQITLENTEVEGVLDSIDQLYEMIKNIKSKNRHFLSNVFMNEDELISNIRKEKLRFHFIKDICLNLYKREWDFDRLYFYVADATKYKIISEGKVITDILCGKPGSELDLFTENMKNMGFSEYARFFRYVSNNNMITDTSGNTITIKKGIEDGFYELLKNCFDRYTDYIPEEADRETFFDNHVCYSAVSENNRLLGGAVLTVKGKTVTEEFIFVDKDFRKKGLSNQIRDYWISDTGKTSVKYISWVRNNNEASMKYLIDKGFRKDGAFKITMMKG